MYMTAYVLKSGRSRIIIVINNNNNKISTSKEGQFLLEEWTLNTEKCLIYCAGPRGPTVSKRGWQKLGPL
jgi:hypothetical protein